MFTGRGRWLGHRIRSWPLHEAVQEDSDDFAGRGHRLEGAVILDALRGVLLQLFALAQVQVSVQGFVLLEKGVSWVNFKFVN